METVLRFALLSVVYNLQCIMTAVMNAMIHTMEHRDTAELLSPLLSRTSLESCWRYRRRGNVCSHVTLVRHLHTALWSTSQHRVAGLQPHQFLGILSDLASKGAPGWVIVLGQETSKEQAAVAEILEASLWCHVCFGTHAYWVCFSFFIVTWYFLTSEEDCIIF